jgi:hypothetical protein
MATDAKTADYIDCFTRDAEENAESSRWDKSIMTVI